MQQTTLILLVFVACASAAPMLYKRNQEEKYEADLVPVSSTVIPLTVLEVSYGVGGKPSEEYKAAYLRKLRKQVAQRQRATELQTQTQTQTQSQGEAAVVPPSHLGVISDAGEGLITVKSQATKAKVKGI